MTPFADSVTNILALGTVALLLAVVSAVVYRLLSGQWLPHALHDHVVRYGLAAAASLSGAALVMSLWYSEVVGLPVCPLCWFARTMMYPLAVILLIAAVRRDTGVVPYALSLAAIGAAITGYHHLYQMGIAPSGACDLLAEGGTCAVRYVFEFGFVTMPLMGFALFCTIGLLLWVVRRA